MTCRISIALAQMLCSQNYLSAGFSDLWSTITHELQEYYEKNLCIPGYVLLNLLNIRAFTFLIQMAVVAIFMLYCHEYFSTAFGQ